jgi:dTMP kinase
VLYSKNFYLNILIFLVKFVEYFIKIAKFKNMNGKFIVFEGVEGCGKTTQIQMCFQWLESLNISAMLTREPGGTKLGTDLRKLLLKKSDNNAVEEVAELLLYAADRAQHIVEKLKPSLAAGKFILCDRYTDSTIAYQGYGRGLNIDLINQLNQIATDGIESDLTIWLDVDVEVGLSRKRGQSTLDRIEQETIDFHRRVQHGYMELHKLNPYRIVRIDGNDDKYTAQKKIQEILQNFLYL